MAGKTAALCVILTLVGSACSGGETFRDGPFETIDVPLPDPGRCAPGAPSDPFYVATNGSDLDGDGSLGQPWATISFALESVPDGSTILVRPGTYNGRVRLDGSFPAGVIVRSEEPYAARLRHNETVVRSFSGQGITLEGFDIAHSGPGADPLVIQIQDLIDDPGGDDFVSRIVLRNNIIHDSFNNDLLKINNGAGDIVVEGNVFYNQSGSDEHIDVNSVGNVLIIDNVFFNDFAASGRGNANDTSSYVVIKDSNGNDDSYRGAERIAVARNIFFNWEGNPGAAFLLIGEDGRPYHEAHNVLVENNLFLGNSANPIRAAFGVKGARDVLFRHNTVSGDFPSAAFAFRFNVEGDNPANRNLRLFNNIWSDPTGTMEDFSDTPAGETASFELDNNLYWNGGASIPSEGNDIISASVDLGAFTVDPNLPDSALVSPVWLGAEFADGSSTTCAVHEDLAAMAVPANGASVIGNARADESPDHDILGNPRQTPDLGAAQL